MVALFKRDLALTVDTLRITNLDASFKVKRTLGREPNTAEVNIRNLNGTNQAALEEKEEVRVVIEAGYSQPANAIIFGVNNTFASGRSVIFNGDLREVRTEREGADLVTRLSSGDGERRRRRARINRSFGRGTNLRTVVEACAEAMGVGLGNLNRITNPEFPGAGAVFPNGTTASGSVADILGEILQSAGFTYSIQDGNLQILARRTALENTTIILSSETGMVDTPSISSDGIMRARTLMIPDLFPGRKVEFRGERVTGFAFVKVADYTGDTASADWFIDVECERLS